MQPQKNAILEVQGLSNNYDGQPLLSDVTFTLGQGEILSLLGPSGSGKTTLLRLVAGLETEASGIIKFDCKNIRSVPPHKRNFGMMFQEYALFPHKTVWQNVAFGLEMQGKNKNEQDKQTTAMLELVGLSGFEQRRIDELSGGERQRVALARSLAPEPQLLLLDEPLGSLDRTLRERLTREIRTILKSLKLTAIFVTHDQAEAFSIADKIAVLRSGTMLQFSTPEEIYRRPANITVARFLGFQNFIEGKLYDGIFESSLGNFPIQTDNTTDPSKTTLLIRPDGAHLANIQKISPGTIKLCGKVNSRQFQGASYNLIVMTSGHLLSFDLPLDPKPPAKGQTIELFLTPSSLILIDRG